MNFKKTQTERTIPVFWVQLKVCPVQNTKMLKEFELCFESGIDQLFRGQDLKILLWFFQKPEVL